MIRLSPSQFKPRKPELAADGSIYDTCHFCDQRTMVKSREPRLGFFVEHDESQQVFKSLGDNRVGTAARVRKRGK